MRDKLARMQARRDPWLFRDQHRAIRYVMHIMQLLSQRKSACQCDHKVSAESQEIWPMSLSAATRIAHDNSTMLRVVTDGAPSLPVGVFEPARVDPQAQVLELFDFDRLGQATAD
jgi:hypothetical protein